MAALPSSSSIRLRLHFDYPPPAAAGRRMCWLLVDLNACRVVADLESIIREKFEFSRRSLVNLFVEDCYLPHTESIYVVRDNDSVRVKLDSVAQVNGHGGTGPEPAGEIHRKRRRASEEEEGVSTEWKKKKRKVSGDGSNRKSPGKPKEKKKKEKKKQQKKKKKKKVVVEEKEEEEEEKVPAAAPKPAAAPTTSLKKSTQTPPVSRAAPPKASSSSSDSSSSEEDDATKTTATKTPPSTRAATKTPPSTCAAPKTPPSTKPTQTKPRPPSSSSSDSGSSSDETASVKAPPTTTPPTPVESRRAPAALQPSDGAQKPTAGAAQVRSDSEEEIQLVIRRPLQPPPRGGGRGMGRGWRGAGPGPGNRGRGGGRGGVRWSGSSLESGCNGAGEPSYRTDTLTNTSVVLQTEAPQQDYSSMPLLAAPPPVGQKIAFKLLELTENYTPQVSEYKEGTIVSFDPTSKQIQLDLLHASAAPVGPGKFDLVYQNPDGSDRVEYAVSRGASVTERWDSLLEPRLIIST